MCRLFLNHTHHQKKHRVDIEFDVCDAYHKPTGYFCIIFVDNCVHPAGDKPVSALFGAGCQPLPN